MDRLLLRFPQEVKNSFSFLEGLGFRCVKSEPTFVRFESSKFAINIYHGRRSYEIGLEIESTQFPTDTYSFSALLRLIDKTQAEQYRYYATHIKQGVAEGVSRLAEDFRRCINTSILDDPKLFARLEVQRKEMGKSLALEVELSQAREKAEIAWQKKDFATIVKLLNPLCEHLATVEIKKLEFAKKKCAKQA